MHTIEVHVAHCGQACPEARKNDPEELWERGKHLVGEFDTFGLSLAAWYHQ